MFVRSAGRGALLALGCAAIAATTTGFADGQALNPISVDPLHGSDAQCVITPLAPCATLSGARAAIAALPVAGPAVAITLASGFHVLDRSLEFGLTTRKVNISGPGGIGAVIRLGAPQPGQTPHITLAGSTIRALAIAGTHMRDPASPANVILLMAASSMRGVTLAVRDVDGAPLVAVDGVSTISQSSITALGGGARPAVQLFDGTIDRSTVSGNVSTTATDRARGMTISSSAVLGMLEARKGRLDVGNSIIANVLPSQQALMVTHAPGGVGAPSSRVQLTLSTVYEAAGAQCRDAISISGRNEQGASASLASLAGVISAGSSQCIPSAVRLGVNPAPAWGVRATGEAVFTSVGPSLLWSQPAPRDINHLVVAGGGGVVAGSWRAADPRFLSDVNPLSPDLRALTPQIGSPVVDGSDDASVRAAAAAYAADVFGNPRRAGAHIDLGAIELQPLALGPIGRLPGVPGIDLGGNGDGALVPIAQGLDGVPDAPGGPVAGQPSTGEAATGAIDDDRPQVRVRLTVPRTTPLHGPLRVRVWASGKARAALVIRRPARGGRSRVMGVAVVRFSHRGTRWATLRLNSGVRRGRSTVTVVATAPGSLPGTDLGRTVLR